MFEQKEQQNTSPSSSNYRASYSSPGSSQRQQKVPTFLAFVGSSGRTMGDDEPEVTKPGPIDVNALSNARRSYKDADAYAQYTEGGETVKASKTAVVSPGAHPWIGGSHGSTATTKKKIVIPPAAAYSG